MTTARLDWIVDQLDVRPGQRVVEIGGGHGVGATAVLARLGPDGRLLGIDRSEKMVAAAQTRNAEAVAEGRARFVVADLVDATVEAGSQDRIFACRVAALAEAGPLAVALSWLAPGGTLALAFDDPDPARTTRLADAASANGEAAGGRVVGTSRVVLPAGEVVVVRLGR